MSVSWDPAGRTVFPIRLPWSVELSEPDISISPFGAKMIPSVRHGQALRALGELTEGTEVPTLVRRLDPLAAIRFAM